MLSVGESQLYVGRTGLGMEFGPESAAPVSQRGERGAENPAQDRTGGETSEPTGVSDGASMESYAEAVRKLTDAAGPGAVLAADVDTETRAAIAALRETDTSVRAHEAAHKMVGGSYVQGGASYTYQIGPDGRQYAIGGEVSIDTSAEADPAETIRKMSTVRAAALAPADPSAQDRAVAAMASQAIVAAQAELRAEQNTASGPEADTAVLPAADGESTDEPAAAGNGFRALVIATYVAANEPAAEPTFRAAA